MISSRRQVITEQDRYGGYNRQPVAKAIIDEPATEKKHEPVQFSTAKQLSGIEIPGGEYTFIRPEGSVSYSKRPEVRADYPETAEYIGLMERPKKAASYTYPALRTRKNLPKRAAEDVMPSIHNKAYVLKESEAKKEERSSVSTRTKLILAVYVAVVLVLAAVVIGTGAVIAGMNDNILSLEYEMARKSESVLVREVQLDKISDDTYLTGLAVQNGMEKITDANEVQLTQTVSPVEFEARTNWFDQFCDWLSGLIG